GARPVLPGAGVYSYSYLTRPGLLPQPTLPCRQIRSTVRRLGASRPPSEGDQGVDDGERHQAQAEQRKEHTDGDAAGDHEADRPPWRPHERTGLRWRAGPP